MISDPALRISLGTALYGDGGERSRHRYLLTRVLPQSEALGTCLFLMLNPSTATARVDDPTIRRCIGFAMAWGYGSLQVCNLFALRATDPSEIYTAADPVGAANDFTIKAAVAQAQLTICAWGNHGAHRGRGDQVVELLQGFELHALSLTKDGHPAHPLYLKKSLKPFLWKEEHPF